MRRRKPIKSSPSTKELQGYLNEVESRQRNLTWPDVLKSSRSADEVFWKGSRNAPMVERIGTMVFAIAFFIAALGLVGLARQNGQPLIAVFALLPLGIGALFTRNALKR
jgi:hypothetical protein